MMNQSLNENYSYIDENIKKIEYNVEEAKAKYRKQDDDIRVMAVTKTVDYNVVNYAASKGLTLLGENKVQEFLEKKDFYNRNCEINFIGHLQSNKIKYIIKSVSLIQSVDSIRLAEEIDRQALKNDITMDVLAEVNIGGEESKSGIMKSELEELVYRIADLKNIRLKGFMTIPPVIEPEKYFCEMQELFNDYKGRNIENTEMSILSMGMSSDYVLGIKYGSNIVRIGTALFGARNYNI